MVILLLLVHNKIICALYDGSKFKIKLHYTTESLTGSGNKIFIIMTIIMILACLNYNLNLYVIIVLHIYAIKYSSNIVSCTFCEWLIL